MATKMIVGLLVIGTLIGVPSVVAEEPIKQFEDAGAACAKILEPIGLSEYCTDAWVLITAEPMRGSVDLEEVVETNSGTGKVIIRAPLLPELDTRFVELDGIFLLLELTPR